MISGRQMIKQERSEYGKQIRKAYEGGYFTRREHTCSSLKSGRTEYVTR